MSDDPTNPTQQPDAPPQAAPARKAVRWAGFVLAIALLGASIWFAIREGQKDGVNGFARLAEADPLYIAALLGLALITAIGINGLMFWVVHRPFVDKNRPVGPFAMIGLLAASALLNYTPVKAGLIGRVAYLKQKHGVAYGAAVLIHMMLAGGTFGALGVVFAVTLWRRTLDAWWWGGYLAGLTLLALVGALMLHYVPPKRVAAWVGRSALDGVGHAFWVLLGCTQLAGLNILGIALRWWVVARMLQVELDMVDAVFLSLITSFTAAMPANGLGMREWLNKLGSETGFISDSMRGQVMTVSLVDRAAEILVVLVSGLIALAYFGGFRRGTETLNESPEEN